MAAFDPRFTKYSLEIPSSYVHEHAGEGKPLLLLVHGYADSGPSFLRRCFPEGLDARFETLAPNGPFPLPQRVENEWKEAYGWYFADLSKRKIYIHPDVAAGGVAGLIERLGLTDRPKVLVGFSQGGYFLPHLAKELRGVERFVLIGAGCHPEYFEKYGLRLPVSAIHGEADDVISLEEARGDFDRLGAANTGGSFHVIPGMTHVINTEGRAQLRRLLGPAP